MIPEPMRFLYEKGHTSNGLAMGRRQFAQLLKEYGEICKEQTKAEYEQQYRLKIKSVQTDKALATENRNLRETIDTMRQMCLMALRKD